MNRLTDEYITSMTLNEYRCEYSPKDHRFSLGDTLTSNLFKDCLEQRQVLRQHRRCPSFGCNRCKEAQCATSGPCYMPFAHELQPIRPNGGNLLHCTDKPYGLHVGSNSRARMYILPVLHNDLNR